MSTESKESVGKNCYCGQQITVREATWGVLRCKVCMNWFHLDCLKDKLPTELYGDIFFNLVCVNCDSNGSERFVRLPMNWLQVVLLTLYNLTRTGNSRHGYFRWREDICGFINKHWDTLMPHRKRTASWHSTVAGVLSLNCPQKFTSGIHEFNEPGWWTLAAKDPPTIDIETLDAMNNSLHCKKRKSSVASSSPIEASELKPRKARRVSQTDSSIRTIENFYDQDSKESSIDPSDVNAQQDDWLNERDITVEETLPDAIMAGEDHLKIEEDDLTEAEEIKQAASSQPIGKTVRDTTKTRRPRLLPLRPHEERRLLQTMKMYLPNLKRSPKACRLYNKLRLRKIKSELGLSIFDLDSCMLTYATKVNKCVAEAGSDEIISIPDVRPFNLTPHGYGKYTWKELIAQYSSVGITSATSSADANILDRFQAPKLHKKSTQSHSSSFLQLLIGSSYNTSLHSICSPYTARVLKPYIWRDFWSTPVKLQLLHDVASYRNKKKQINSNAVCEIAESSIDYCYVRPHHIPVVNNLCREFFWPGIDLSECLEYPDFSVVALYRKLIVGFAFMTPDVKYHEAYISFIFVHPDWRRAGIATFMLYHLIQTCMGKDVTLHVSATNPAMLMYQKFGFKPEEFVLDFYDKYLPERNTDCRHAFLMRLKR